MAASHNELSRRARLNALRDALRLRFGAHIIPDPRTLRPRPRGRHPLHGRGVHAGTWDADIVTKKSTR